MKRVLVLDTDIANSSWFDDAAKLAGEELGEEFNLVKASTVAEARLLLAEHDVSNFDAFIIEPRAPRDADDVAPCSLSVADLLRDIRASNKLIIMIGGFAAFNQWAVRESDLAGEGPEEIIDVIDNPSNVFRAITGRSTQPAN